MTDKETIGARLARLRAPTGFDYLRLLLAIAVLCYHSVLTSYGSTGEEVRIWATWLAGPSRLILPMFFALSGFLVAGSIFRSGSTSGFILLRAIRLVPALAVEVTLTTVFIGAIFTTLPRGGYFMSHEVWRYSCNIVGHIQYFLPGVFEENPYGRVNQSLWTIPYELKCYIALVFLMITGLVRVRWAVLALVVLGCAAIAIKTPVPSIMHIAEARLLVIDFLAGVCVYLFRDRLPMSTSMFISCLLFATAAMYWWSTSFVTPPLVAYLTVWLGMQNPRKPAIMDSGDYSYGIYLYAFPIQQTVAYYPVLRAWWINIALALPLTLLFAAFSWHAVEKHVLRYKRAVAGKDALLPRLEAALLGHARRGWRAVTKRHVDTPAQVDGH